MRPPRGINPRNRRPDDTRGRRTRLDRRALPPGRDTSTSWDHVAAWYDKLVGDVGSDYHRHVILPAALRLLDPQPGERFLDVCCGQGVLARVLLEKGASFVLGVDASPRLIEAARQRTAAGPRALPHTAAAPRAPTPESVRFVVRDATRLGPLADGRFDGAACVMAVQDVEELGALFAGLASALRPGGRAAIVMMHPCFRVPRQMSWAWDAEKRTQYRRVDRYATPLTIPIATHPGRDPGVQTLFHHRPLADYINALGAAGLAIVACEEPLTHRRSTPGSHSRGENRAAEEIPVFLGLRAVKPANEGPLIRTRRGSEDCGAAPLPGEPARRRD